MTNEIAVGDVRDSHEEKTFTVLKL